MKKKDPNNLQRVFQIVRLTHLFQQIQRKIRATDEHRWENNAEHTFQLIFVAVYVIDTEKLKLDLLKVILYILCHDIVEVYAGDPCIFTDGPEAMRLKPEREALARKRLRAEFPEFSILHKTLEVYEKQEDAEAKFAYAIDKFVPFCNVYLDNGLTWTQFHTTIEELLAEKERKIRVSHHFHGKLDEFLEILKRKQGELFPPFVKFPQDKHLPLPVQKIA